MYVKKLSLRNVRAFKTLDFDFQRDNGTFAGWTVVTGENGSGKSSVLKSIALALMGTNAARTLQPSLQGWVTEGTVGRGSMEVDIVWSEAEDRPSQKGTTPSNPFPAKLELDGTRPSTTLEVVTPTGRAKNYSTPQRTVWADNAAGWFCCGYGPFRRVFGASPDATRAMMAPITERFVTMFQEAASLAEVDQWLKTLAHKKLENRKLESQQLELLIEILDDEFMPNGIRIDRVDSDGLWLRDRKGLKLSWHEMSDGYRAALALLADIIRHLINCFGIDGLVLRNDEGRLEVVRPGVVLIDEVDAHLHPEWQRELGYWLTARFPNIQFIVTTHSPLICQAADQNGLFVLPEPGSDEQPRALTVSEYETVITSRPDTILLTPAFGLANTRSPVAVEARAAFSKLQAKKRAGASLDAEEVEKEQALSRFAVTDEGL